MDAERAAYLAEIEERFVALRGRGFVLSPRDVMLVDGWRTRGVPTRVVLGALEEGIAEFAARHPPRTPPPTTLSYFAGRVEDAIAARRELLVGADPVPIQGDSPGGSPGGAQAPGLRQTLLDVIAAAGRVQPPQGPAREALREAWRQVSRAPDGDLWAAAQEADRALVDTLLATLEAPEREALEGEARRAVQAAGGERMSARGRRDAARAALEAAVRARFGIADLLEVLVERAL